MPPPITHAAPMTHVADVQRTIAFYQQLGLTLRSRHHAPDGRLVWADLSAGDANLMFVVADEPVVAEKQAVLFYLYSQNLVVLREHLLAERIAVSEITYPFYMEKGEMRVTDPDGYVILVGQSNDSAD